MCPVKGNICNSCNNTGHFAKLCRNKPSPVLSIDMLDQYETEATRSMNVNINKAQVDSLEADLFIGAIFSDNQPGLWHVDIHIADQGIRFKLDTGSEANLVPRSVFDCLPKMTLMSSCDLLRTLDSPRRGSDHRHQGTTYQVPGGTHQRNGHPSWGNKPVSNSK